MGGNGEIPSNSLYLLRYHEEMNELAVDAQLNFGDGNGEEDGSGEMWCMSSCPMDKTLLVSCRDNCNGNGAETALWRIPEKAMREDEIDYYPDEMDGGGGFNRNFSSDMNEIMEKVDLLRYDNDLHSDSHMTAIGGGDIERSAVLKGRVSDLQWNPDCLPHSDDGTAAGGGGGVNFLTVDHTINGNPTMTTWDIGTSAAIPVNRVCVPSNERKAVLNSFTVPNPPRASWDPHNTNLIATTAGLNVAVADIRTGYTVLTLKQCHKFGVTDVDHNPNKPNILSSCGQDSLVKFWDLRYSSTSFDDNGSKMEVSTPTSTSMRQQPLRILRGGHMHWSTRVKYNSFHDQLLLSGGTDGMVNLWRVSSISSAPLLDLGNTSNDDVGHDKDFGLSAFSGLDEDEEEKVRRVLDNDDDGEDLSFSGNDKIANQASFSDDTDGGNAPDVRVTKMEMRDAVYDLEWSAADPWVYVTLSFDGNVVLNHVPSKEKYKILL